MNYQNLLEEELKDRVGNDWFGAFDHSQVIGRLDFAVAVPAPQGTIQEPDEVEYLL